MYSLGLRQIGCLIYQRPYLHQVDNEYPFMRRYKAPKFALFSRKTSQLIIKYIGTFTIQYGEYANNDFYKLHLVPNPHITMVFSWHTSLSLNSIQTWQDMERQFHI